MSKMQSLTINGNEYTVADPDAATINDPVVGQAAWSSKNIVDRLCPAFSESGAVATCQPVEGYPLEVISHIQPAQAGSGDPSPDNIRPITGHTAMKLSLSNDVQVQEFTLDLGQTVYGGSLNWHTGELTIDREVLAFNGTEKWAYSNPNDGYCRIQQSNNKRYTKDTRVCSHYSLYSGYSAEYTFPYMRANDGTGNWVYEGKQGAGYYASADDFKAYLAEQYAAGTPVQVCYQLAAPVTIQLTPQEILALSGVNTLYSDTGDTTVTGRVDPAAVIDDLKARIAALETAVISNT